MPDIIDLLQIKIEKAKSQLSDDTLNAIAAVPWKDVIWGMREKRGYNFEQLGDLELETELVLCGLVNPKDYPKEVEKRLQISKAETNELVAEMNQEVFAKIKEELIKNTDRKKTFEKKVEISKPTQLEPVKIVRKEEDKIDTQMFSEHGIEIIPDQPKIPPQTPLVKEKIEIVPILPKKEAEAQLVVQTEKLELEAPPVHVNPPVIVVPTPKKPLDAITPTRPLTPQAPEPIKIDKPESSILAQKLSSPVQMNTIKTEHGLDNITKTNPTTSYTKNTDPYRLPPGE